MLTLYHAPGTRSVRCLWLMGELSLDANVETVPFTAEALGAPGFRAISPAGKLPVLVDGDITLFESGAIQDYLLDRYDSERLLKPSAKEASLAAYYQWCWFSEATLIRPLGMARMLRGGNGDELAAEASRKVLTALHAVDNALTGQRYLLGARFSGADIMMGYSLELLRRFALLDGEQHPAAAAYLRDITGRAACIRALSDL